MIFTYSKEHVGDVLMVIVKDSKGAKLNCERRSKVTRIFLEKKKENSGLEYFCGIKFA